MLHALGVFVKIILAVVLIGVAIIWTLWILLGLLFLISSAFGERR